jgi:hypothetical protein
MTSQAVMGTHGLRRENLLARLSNPSAKVHEEKLNGKNEPIQQGSAERRNDR